MSNKVQISSVEPGVYIIYGKKQYRDGGKFTQEPVALFRTKGVPRISYCVLYGSITGGPADWLKKDGK